ncbi:nucleoside hydrolase [Mycolicibacillus koreensis]|uniref:nucleoside hydrolase n=1 Tax=Mycolicibacillus koreensis TaxID=1069220 RepID=UPI00138BAF20|nr:nucleoside hydrolase [Mycolicibacillus koreensis]BBY54900.1 nucleoside hydrolase [Mycolicibacillus koreensis]
MRRAELPVFLDCDTGVDDALALAYLIGCPEVDLVGVAATGGNVAVDQVCRNNLDLVALCGSADIPVSAGSESPLGGPLPVGSAHGATGLGYALVPSAGAVATAHDAATAWVRAAHRHPGRLVGVVTGPLTNLALALQREPALPTLLGRLVVMGGAYGIPVYRGNVSPVAEWNISVDPEAAAAVLAGFATALTPPLLCGLDLTTQVLLTPHHFQRLAAVAGSATTPLLRVLEDATRYYFEVHRDAGYGYAAHPHDALAAAAAVDPGLVTAAAATVEVELAGTVTRGMTVVDWSGLWGRAVNAQIGVAVDPAVFLDRFIDRVGTLAGRLAHS